MSTETQAHQEWVNQEAAREAEREQLDAIAALYDQPCCKQTARMAYLEGRVDRSLETFEKEVKRIDRLLNETPTMEHSPAETDKAVHGNGNSVLREVRGNVRSRVRP